MADVSSLHGAIERVEARFSAVAPFASSRYVSGKLRRDPVNAATVSLGDLGEVLDLGCGRGQLAALLLEYPCAASVVGLDFDEAKVALAQRACEGLSARFSVGDVRDLPQGLFDTVLLIDVLHYLPEPQQDDLLAQIADRLRHGGRLVMRDADRGRGLRSRVTLAQEAVGRFFGVNRGERLLFRDIEREVVPRLERLAFDCHLTPCWAGTPFSNVLLVAQKRRRA